MLAFVLLAVLAGRGQAATPLVDADWLVANAGKPGLVVLDVRNKFNKVSKETFKQGHIPGAVYSDYLNDGWREKVDGVPGQLAPIDKLEALIGGLGIGNDSHVVVVAGGTSALDMGSATRVYWTFKVLGHDEVSILDGGYRAYLADAGNPVEKGWRDPAPRRFKAAFRPELVADREQALAASKAGGVLIDNRPRDFYLGKTNHPAAKRKGTIPGAVNVPEGSLVGADGRFVEAATAAALLDEAGVGTEGEQITFCNTGHWASLGWFVNSEIIGNKQTKVYDGSMVDWSARASLPIQVGAPAE
jgi:thiosulfate/3-mercaptopyruvate sulfurtransferase